VNPARAADLAWPSDAESSEADREPFAAYDALETSEPVDVSGLRLSDGGVRLGLAGDLLVTRTPAELADPAEWSLNREEFRAHLGPFSALDLLDNEREAKLLVGSHSQCAAQPAPIHPDLRELRHLSITPIDITSCLQWSTGDVANGVTDSLPPDCHRGSVGMR